MTDDLANTSKTQSASGGLRIATDQPALFGGDGARLARTGATAGSLIYRLDNLTTFRATTWSDPAAPTGDFNFFTSSDGLVFTPVTVNRSQLGGDWQRVDYSFDAPACANFVKLEFPAGGSANTPQVGSAQFAAHTPLKENEFYWLGGTSDIADGLRVYKDNASLFDGDFTRVGRNDNGATGFTVRLANMRQFEAEAYFDPAFVAPALTFAASSDGVNFAPVGATQVVTAGNWSKTHYSGALPNCSAFLRVGFPAGGSPLSPQLSRLTYSASAPAPAMLEMRVYAADFRALAGWTISATNTGSGALTTHVSDDAGLASFALAAGNYTICESVPPGWTVLYPGNPCYWVSLGAGQSSALNFQNSGGTTPTSTATAAAPSATPTNTPILPTNTPTMTPVAATSTPAPLATATTAANASTVQLTVRTTTFAPISGWTVVANNSSTGAQHQAISNAAGVVVYTLNPGNYTLCVTLPPGWRNTLPGNPCYWLTVGASQSISLSSLNISDGTTATATATPSATPSTGPQLTIFVLRDDFSALSGWAVQLDSLATGATQQLVTNASGQVVFNAGPGSFKVCETLQAGWRNVFPGNTCYWLSLSTSSASINFRNANP